MTRRPAQRLNSLMRDFPFFSTTIHPRVPRIRLLDSARIACLLFCAAAALSAAQQVPQRLHHRIDDTQTFRLRGQTRPVLALAQDLGALADSQALSGLSIHFSLTPAQESALARLQSQLQDPSSEQFHKFLTPEQYGARFGLNTADLEKITRWLEQSGFSSIEVARSRTSVKFSGTAGQIQAAFHTALRRYSYRGEQHFANTTDPLLPKALDGIVKGMLGLHDIRMKPNLHIRPQFTFGSNGHGLVPDDFATIYDLKPLYGQGIDGTGVKIAVLAQTNVNLADIQKFRSLAALPAKDPQVVLVGADPGIIKDDEVESDLDLEWAGGVARNATVLLVVGNNTNGNGVLDALVHTIDNNLAPVVSMSYGGCESNITSADYTALSGLLSQAAAQGITVLASSGDSGPAGCDTTTPATHTPAVIFPASSQYVTGVGGTVFDADSTTNTASYWSFTNGTNGGSALAYIGEAVWNDQDPSGSQILVSGGGASALTPKPVWQVGTGVPNDGARDVPDLAFSASPYHDPYLICAQGSCVSGFGDTTGRIMVAGGTSATAPAMAGIAALLVQKTGEPQGNINPRLYAIAASSPNSFHDVTRGTNLIKCDSTTTGCTTGEIGFQAIVGYDQATGLGSLDVSSLLNAWPDFGLSASPTALIVQRGASATANISVSPANGFDQTVALACKVADSLTNVTCSIPSAPSSGIAQLTITAGATARAPFRGWPPFRSQNPWTGTAMLLAVGTFFLWQHRRAKLLVPASACVLLLAVTVTTASCGNGSASGATTTVAVKPISQTGAVTVTATARESSKSVSVTVTVQ